MARIVTLKCDRCGKEGMQDTNQSDKDYIQLWQIGIFLQWTKTPSAGITSVRDRQEWCRECVASIDLLNDKRAAYEKEAAKAAQDSSTRPYVETTLEDKIREIIREEIQG